MRKIRFVFACLVIVMGLAAATPSQALVYRSYVSGNGSGAACTRVAPCFHIDDAISVTQSGGIVTCLDGDMVESTVTIDRSITIDCGGVSVAPQTKVTINGAGIVVTLRNLTIIPLGGNVAGIGIDFQLGAALFVEHCVIEHFQNGSGVGIFFEPAGVAAKLHVTDSVIKNNGLAQNGGGIYVRPTGGGSARVVIERTQVENNTTGIFANGTGGVVLVEVKDSTIANNAFYGIDAYTGGSTTSVVVDHSSLLHNGGSGIYAEGAGAYVSLNGAKVTWNAAGLTTVSGGLILSYQNNLIGGNLSPGVTPLSVALQ